MITRGIRPLSPSSYIHVMLLFLLTFSVLLEDRFAFLAFSFSLLLSFLLTPLEFATLGVESVGLGRGVIVVVGVIIFHFMDSHFKFS